MIRQILDSEIVQEIVLVRKVARSPHKPGCGGFRMRLPAGLNGPLHSLPITNHDFWISAMEIFFDKREVSRGLMLLPTWPIEQVPARNIGGWLPQHADSFSRNLRGARR